MGLPLTQITDPHTRNVLQVLHERTAAVERVDPSAITLGTLYQHLDAGGQTVTGIADAEDNQDLTSLSALRQILTVRLTELKGLADTRDGSGTGSSGPDLTTDGNVS